MDNSTLRRDWDTAVKLGQQIEENYERAAVGKPVISEGQTIENAVRLYLMDKESKHLSPATLSKLTTIFAKQFQYSLHSHLQRSVNYLVETLARAALIPPPTASALPSPQKCMKKSRGSSFSM